MRREPNASLSCSAPVRRWNRALSAAGLARASGVCVLLALGACAGPDAAPQANSAVIVQRAYAENAQLRGVADALDARLDQMVAQQTAMLAR
jgi:hypothetical protein